MRVTRMLCGLLALLAAAPAIAKKKDTVRLTVGPFTIEPKRDREICQAVRIPNVPGMEIAAYDVRSLSSQGGKVGSHHLVVYGYAGPNAARVPLRKNPRDVVDVPGCNGFGPDDLYRNRIQLAGSGGEFRRGKWLLTQGSTPLGLATLLPNPQDAPRDAILVINSHYFNGSSKVGRGFVRITLRLKPYDGRRRVVRSVTPIDASYDIDVPPGQVRESTGTWQADGAWDPNGAEGGYRPSKDVCILLMTTHTHKRGTHVTVAYEEDGKEPLTLFDPDTYDYVHPNVIALPSRGGVPPAGNLLRAYTAENGHPRLRYTCTHANGAAGREMKMGCEETPGVVPGIRWRDALAGGLEFGNARPCGADGVNCQGFGTGRCVASNLVFGPLSDDEMCIIPMFIYDPIPGAPPETACDPYGS
jgi:hypothetical protein